MKLLVVILMLVLCAQAYGTDLNESYYPNGDFTFGDLVAEELMQNARHIDFIEISNDTTWAPIMASAMKHASIDVVYGGAIWLCVEGTAPAGSSIIVNGQPVINTTRDGYFQLVLPETNVPHFLDNISISYKSLEKAKVNFNHASTWVDAPGTVFYNPGNTLVFM